MNAWSVIAEHWGPLELGQCDLLEELGCPLELLKILRDRGPAPVVAEHEHQEERPEGADPIEWAEHLENEAAAEED